MQIAFDEPTIEIHKSKKDLNIVGTLWGRPVCNSFNPQGVHAYAILAYNKPKEVYLLYQELALLHVGIKAKTLELCKDFAHIAHMAFSRI